MAYSESKTMLQNFETIKNNNETDINLQPKLKYIRMANYFKHKILPNASVSCVAVHMKFICIGTDNGVIYFVDHQGDFIEIEKSQAVIITKSQHTINQISIDLPGDHIACCLDDGRILVHGLCNRDNNCDIQLERLVRCIAIDPYYYRSGSGRRFISGDERLILHEKTFLTRNKQTVLADVSKEGGVQCIQWNPEGHLVAWATNVSFRIYDLHSKTSLGNVKWGKHILNLKRYLCWKDKTTLIVCWFKIVKVFQIKLKSVTSSIDISSYYVEPVYSFQTDFIICGAAPLGDRSLVLLVFDSDVSGNMSSYKPQIHIIEPKSEGEAVSYVLTDKLVLNDCNRYNSDHYSLEYLTGESWFLIVSPRDLVIACPYDDDDKVDWLLSHDKYKEAIAMVQRKLVSTVISRHTLVSVGRLYVDYLLSKEEYTSAASLCKEIFGTDRKLWEAELNKFAAVKQLRSISQYIPMDVNYKMSTRCYDIILYEYLLFDPKEFLEKIKQWPSHFYNIPVVIKEVIDQTVKVNDNNTKEILLESLAILYSLNGKHDKALAIYTKLEKPGVFDLIKSHMSKEPASDIINCIYNYIEDLMRLNCKEAAKVITQIKNIDVDIVVKKLANEKYYLYVYLDELKNNHSRLSQNYHNQLVELYANYDKKKLLRLLKESHHYSIQKALDLCMTRHYLDEAVYLLEKIGNLKEALHIIMHKLNDINKAIEFCKKENDPELYNDLITYSLDKPDFVSSLLQSLATRIDPRLILMRVKNDVMKKIPDLNEALVKMMHDYNLQVSVQENCQNILISDYYSLHRRLIANRNKGINLTENHVCGVCTAKIINSDCDNLRDIVLFNCTHTFHASCLKTDTAKEIFCSICSDHKNIFNKKITF